MRSDCSGSMLLLAFAVIVDSIGKRPIDFPRERE